MDRYTPRGLTMTSPGPTSQISTNFGHNGVVDRRAHNLRVQMATETNRLVDTLRSLERTLGTHILALTNILKPPREIRGARDDRDQHVSRTHMDQTIVINEDLSQENKDKDKDEDKDKEKDRDTDHDKEAGDKAGKSGTNFDEETMDNFSHKKVIATVSVVFLKIGLIEPSHDRFYAEIYVQAHWAEPAFDGHLQLDPAVVDWSAIWGPSLRFDNAMDDIHKTTWHTITFNGAGKALVHERHRLEGTFRQQCDITEFPFDTQEVSIVVATILSEAEITMVLDRKEWPRVLGQSSGSKQEWNIAKTVITTRKITNDPYRERRFSHAALKFSVGISRKFRLYVVEYAIIVFFVSAAAFTSFGIDVTTTGYRLMTCILVLLCLVTFQFAVSHERPTVAFITHLDEYVFAHVVITCLLCVWHAVMNTIPFGSYSIEDVDKIIAGGFGIVFIFNEISFLAVAIAAGRANKSRLKLHRKPKRDPEISDAAAIGEFDHLKSHGTANIVESESPKESVPEIEKQSFPSGSESLARISN